MKINRKISIFFFILPLLYLNLGFTFFSSNWETVYSLIDFKYPEVKHIEVNELNALIGNEEKILLIDVREPKEYKVSTLKGAINVQHIAALKSYPPDKKYILFCSVGYRSAQLASTMMKNGFTNVYNLKGSIFRWANSTLPVYRGNKRVYVVHPYNRKWGKLLKSQYHSYTVN